MGENTPTTGTGPDWWIDPIWLGAGVVVAILLVALVVLLVLRVRAN